MSRVNRATLAEDVRRMEKYLSEKYGVNIILSAQIFKESLEQILKKVNDALKTNFPGVVPEGLGIMDKSRKAEVIMYRYFYFMICTTAGYSQSVSSKFIGFDHATMVHGRKKFENMVFTGDPTYTKYWHELNQSNNEQEKPKPDPIGIKTERASTGEETYQKW